MQKRQKAMHRHISSFQVIILGFFSVILFGSLLLTLPFATRDGNGASFADALFTSTSAVCVTGLVVHDTATYWSMFGQAVILLLIQIGGMGVVTVAVSIAVISGRKIGLMQRSTMQEAIAAPHVGGIVRLTGFILKTAMLIEAVGVAVMAPVFCKEFGFFRGIWYALFHSVSAFCNAGIDILGEDSLARYVTNPLINITTMMLIILGGIGFTVWYDVIDNGKKIWYREIPKKWCFTRLKLHSKIAIVTTLILLIAGTLLNFVLEYRNPETIGNLNTGQKIMASAFQAVTTRTAGFSTFQQSGMHEETGFLNIILMFIGGSPGGTAGGLKTTTFALLFLAFHTMLRGGHDIECFQRKVAEDSLRVAFVTFMLALGIYVTGTTVIAVIEPDTISLQKIMYETASAMATVGLTQDLTTHLRVGSKIVLMILMYAGRVGPMTIALLFAGKVNLQEKMRTLPTEKIMIG